MTAAPAARGPYRSGIRRRQQIVAAASEVFGESGYLGGSLRTVAERVGVSPATVIQHFGSKEGLLTAVLQAWTEQTEAELHSEPARGLAGLRSLHHLMEFNQAHRGLLELFLSLSVEATSASHPAHDFITRRYAGTRQRWRRELRWAVDHGEVRPMDDAEIDAEVRRLIAMADGLELQWLLDPTIGLTDLFADYLDRAIERWQGDRR